ncbi:N-acetyl-gamma-glutamyl-phosphate reductase [Paraburkholderia sp. A3RO-2L]|uniref:N-acetyl-gamma-glutamyl-phosphate reductase n=1 Tax=unclassified Paraburkholderia TaxID=2615204 RepID=UPI003DA97460
MSQRLFVDGAAGTVGMALQPYLEQLQAEGLIELIVLPDSMRKIWSYRKHFLRQADIVVLCLPDDEAGEAVSCIETYNPDARILDASAAHRCHPDWVYGLPEFISAQEIARARKVANPGCFATACILAGKPLVDAFGLGQLVFQGITGYSAGGRKGQEQGTPRLVQFGKAHRHLPEIARFTGARAPVLTTTVGPWKQGMLVQSYIDQPADVLLKLYEDVYRGHQDVHVTSAESVGYRVNPKSCNGSNEALICVAGQPNGGSSVAVVIDNLGKGSAGAAAANLRLMLTGQ